MIEGYNIHYSFDCSECNAQIEVDGFFEKVTCECGKKYICNADTEIAEDYGTPFNIKPKEKD